MVKCSLIQLYELLKSEPTPAMELILAVGEVTGRKESAIRKWLDGSARPDAETCANIERKMEMTLDTLVVEYHRRIKQPTPALLFRKRLESATHKSKITILRYVNGITMPDELTKITIADELNTPVSVLFP